MQPGVVLDTLRARAERDTLTFGPDPSTHSRCTLGGMIGNNSCGTHSLLAGKTVDNVEELRIVLYDGTQLTVGRDERRASWTRSSVQAADGARSTAGCKAIRDRYAGLIRERFPDIPRRVSGYNLDQLLPENGFNVARALVGSEGTCAIVLEAKARLIASPQHRSLVALGYADAYEAADHVPDILELKPIGLEGFEGVMIDGAQAQGRAESRPHPGGGRLSAGGVRRRQRRRGRCGGAAARGSRRSAHATRRTHASTPRPKRRRCGAFASRGRARRFRRPARRRVRKAGTIRRCAPHHLGAYLRDLRALLNEYNYQAVYYGHFGHGCIHMQMSFDLQSEDGIRKYA